MSFAETNDNVAGVEVENQRTHPPASACGVELTPDGIERALDSYLLGAVRAAGTVAPDQEAATVARLRDRFSVVFTAAGTTGIAAKSGRPFAEEVAEALAQARPDAAEDPRVVALRARVQEQLSRTNPFLGSPVGPPPPHGHVPQFHTTYRKGER
jgi:hypothetical protein